LPSNDMSTGEIRSFSCESNARGTSLAITIKRKHKMINFCEVFIFGTGMVAVKA